MNSFAKTAWTGVAVVIALCVLVVMPAALYTLDETEQAVIVQFGAPVGDPIKQPGLHMKLPFVQEVRRFDKRLLSWDGDPNQVPTRGREFISVDTTARWRIEDPLLFLQSVHDESGAQSRLDDIIDSVVRDELSSTELGEIVRSKNWDINEADIAPLAVPAKEERVENLKKAVRIGREELTRSILEEARKDTPSYGIELKDVRIKRLNYIPSVQKQVFNRMISERQRIAERFRAEGEGQSSEIRGQTLRREKEILSEARRKGEMVRGKGDAEATRVYNEAYGADPEFYAFFRSLESYGKSIDAGSTLILTTDADYYSYLKRLSAGADAGAR